METKEFKKHFDVVAKLNGFDFSGGGWYMESTETIVVLDLQKSNYGNYFELNIKIFLKGIFGNSYTMGKDLVKKLVGNIFRRQPPEYASLLDLDQADPATIVANLENFFKAFLVSFAQKALTKQGIIELANSDEILLLPAAKEFLGIG